MGFNYWLLLQEGVIFGQASVLALAAIFAECDRGMGELYITLDNIASIDTPPDESRWLSAARYFVKFVVNRITIQFMGY